MCCIRAFPHAQSLSRGALFERWETKVRTSAIRGAFDRRAATDDNRGVLAAMIDQFGRECVRRIAGGECLSDAEARAFAMLLDARERSGRRLLGAMAGPDASSDTVSGRCGLRPRFDDLR